MLNQYGQHWYTLDPVAGRHAGDVCTPGRATRIRPSEPWSPRSTASVYNNPDLADDGHRSCRPGRDGKRRYFRKPDIIAAAAALSARSRSPS